MARTTEMAISRNRDRGRHGGEVDVGSAMSFWLEFTIIALFP
jgi:hypothetical protein